MTRWLIGLCIAGLFSTFGVLLLPEGTPATAHHHDGHMTHSEPSGHHCPFMVHGEGEALCPMSALDHLGIMRDLFEFLIPTISVLISLVIVANTIKRYLPFLVSLNRIYSPPPRSKTIEHLTTIWHRQYQELFSNGILNPKYY